MHKHIPILLIAIFGLIVLSAYFLAIFFVFTYGSKDSSSTEVILTRLSDLAFLVVSFFFSSSLGSKTKDKKK